MPAFMYKQSRWCQSEFPRFSCLTDVLCWIAPSPELPSLCRRQPNYRSLSRKLHFYMFDTVGGRTNEYTDYLTFSISPMVSASMFSIVSIKSCENN